MSDIETQELLEQTGLSNATLRKYSHFGLIAKPTVERKGPGRVTSTYPADTLLKLNVIAQLKEEKISLSKMHRPLAKALATRKVSQWLEEKGARYRSQKSNEDIFIQYVSYALLLEAEVDISQIDDEELLACLRDVSVERNSAGAVESIKISVDKEIQKELTGETKILLDLLDEVEKT